MEDEEASQPSFHDSNFYFGDIVYFKEENCIISNCSNHSPEKCRQSKFLLFPIRPEWKEIIAGQVEEEVNLDHEDVRICGKHFAEPAAEDLAPSLFGFETLKEHAGIPYKAQKWCCVKNCSNGYQKYSGTTTSTRKPAVYYPLAKLADDDVGRSLMKNLMAKVNSIEDHSAFICHLHLKVLHIDDEVTDAENFKYSRGKNVRYTSNKYNIKLDCNLDTTDKSCCVIPSCVFADKTTVYSMGDKQWRPSMFPFPSLHRQPVPRMIWLRLVREAMPEDQKQFCPSVTSKICGLHFPDGKPTLANPDPTHLEKKIIFPPELDASSVKSRQKEHPFDLSTSAASDALKKAVELRGLVEGKRSNTIHSNAVNPSVAHDESEIESDDDLDNRLQECQQLMEEDSEDDSEEETDDASENESDEEMQEGADNSFSQDSFENMGRKLKRFFRYKDWINAMRVLEKITESFNETFVGTADEDKVFVSVDREGTEQNCAKETKTEALQYVKEHFLQEQDWSQLDLMLKHFDIIEDMPPVETSDESDGSSEEEDEGSDAAERSLLLSLSKKFKYHLKSLEWTKADKTLNRVTLVFFEAVIMDSCSSKPGKKLKEEVSRRQSFKTAELKAVEHLRKQLDSINEQKLMNEMLKLFGRHSAVSKSFISSADVIHTPLQSKVQHQPALKPKLQTSTIPIKTFVVKATSPAFQSSQLMKEIKAMESELMVAASKAEAKKVSDILKQIGIRLIAVEKKISIQQVEKDYEEISSPMELKQKALQYLKQHGILCQVRNERNQTSIPSAPTKHHTRQTTILHDTIKAIETPKENTDSVVYQEATSSADHVATSIEPGVKRKYANELQVDKNALQTIYVHFNIEPPKKRRRKKITSINGSKTLTTKSSSIHDETTAQLFNQPIPVEKNVRNDEETVACFESESQGTHIEELQDNKEKCRLNDDSIENKSQEELCMVTHGNKKHLQNDKEKLKDQNKGEVENNSEKGFCMDTDEMDMTRLQDEKETVKPQNEGCIENKSHEDLCMNADENDLKQEHSLENKSIENHLENNLKEDEHCQALKVSPKNCIPEECPKKITLQDNFKEVCNRTDLKNLEDHQLSEIETQTSDSNFETSDSNKDICCKSENNKTILDSKTGVLTKDDDISKDVITTVPDNDDKKHETILDAKTGAWVKQLKDSSELPVDNFKENSNEIDNISGNISGDIQYIVTFDATNFKRWKLLTEGELGTEGENIVDTNSSSPILSTIIKGAIDSDLPSLVYQAKSSGKQLTSVDQKVSKNEIKADVNVDQTQPIDNVASDIFEGIASGYPGYTASTTPQVKRIPVFAFYNEFRPWLLFPFGRALRKLLLCTPIRMSNQKDKPTSDDDNQFVIDLTDAEMKNAVQELAKVLGKWEKVKDANTYFNGIKVVVNDLLKTSESGIFWNMFVKSFIEAVDKELPNIVAQCEEEIKKAKDTKETKLQVVAKETDTNPPPPPPLKHGPSMQPKGKVSTFTSMPELSHCSTKQPSIVMPALKPCISNQIQQGQGVTISMPPRLVGPFTSNRKILSKGTTGQVQTQPPSNMVSVKIGKSNIILLPTSQGKTQFVVGNSPVTTVNAQPVSKSQVFQINCASNQTSSTSGGTPIILNQPQLTNAKVTQNKVKSVSAGQSVGHLMVPVTVPGLQKGYVMFVPHTVNLSTTSQTPVSTVSSVTPSPAVKSNASQPISSTIPLVHKPQCVDAEDKQENDKMKELVTDDNVITSKENPESTTSSNLSESILLQNVAVTKFTENQDKDVQLDNSSTQMNKENVNDHGSGEMEVVYQPEKLSSICKQVLKKMNNEDDLSEASFHDEEPDEGSGSSSDSNSPPDKPSNNDGTPEHEESSEKKPKTKPFQQNEQSNEGKTNLSVTHMKSDAASSCISKSTSSVQQLLANPSLVSNAATSTACYAPFQQLKDPMIFINRAVPGQAAPLPFLVMQTHTIPRPLLMKTSENGQRDISALSPTASSQLFKESKKLNVPYLTINNKQETSLTISSSSNNSNSMDDIKSSDFKQNTTIPRNGSLHLQYLKVWNSQFHRFEDLAVQKYKEECKLHTKLHQLSSITKQIYKHVSANFNRKKGEVHEDDQTKSETMAVKGTKSLVCSDKGQSSKQLSGEEIKDKPALESKRDDDKGLVEEKLIANKCNAGSCVESKELAKKDKTPDDMQNEAAPAIIKSEANIRSVPTNSTSESNQGKDYDKKKNDGEKCTPDMVSTSGSSVCSAPFAVGSNERTRLSSEHPQIDNVDSNFHHHNGINPNNSVNDSLCITKKDPKELCDSGCTCNMVQMCVCDNCFEVFSSMEDLNKHVVIHLSTEKVLPMFSCEKCQLNFTSKGACDCHRESHNDLKWNRCAWCGMMFNQVENLENHLLVHYDVNNERIYECKCSRLFIGLKAIRMHMEDHFPDKTDKKHQCNQCTASFHFVKNVKKHTEDIHNMPSDRWLNVHWRCQKCLSNSTSIHRLNAHMEDHNDKTEFTCGNCPKSFQYFLDYIMHCMNHCEDRVGSIFNCPICDGLFGIDIKTHIKQHLSGMKKCQFCLRFFATSHGLNKHLTEKHKAKIAEKQRTKIAEKHKFKMNTEHTPTSNNRDSGAAAAINKSLSNQNKPKIAEGKEGHYCSMCGIRLGTGNFDHPICSTCAKDCLDCPFTCGAKLSNQRHLTSHLVAHHMDRKKHDPLLLVCPHCQTSCRNAGTMALHWIKHCPKNKKRLEMNNNTDKWLEKIEVLETLPALQIIRKHKKKKRKHVDRDDETYTKFKKKKKHKKSKRRVGHKLPQRPYVKLDSHRKHRYKYSALESHREHKSMYSDLVPKLSTRHDKHEIKCVGEVRDPVNTAEPTKRNRKKRVYEDMIEIPRSVLLPKLPLNKVITKQHKIKDIAIDNIKKPRRTSRISKPKEFPDYEEDIDKALRNNQAIKKQKVETSKSQKKINAAPKPEKETVKSNKPSRTSCPVTNEESDSDIEVYETHQASLPVKDRVRPSNLRPRINSGHKWDLFHVDTILSTIDKLKSRLGRKNRSKDSDVNKKLLKKGKLLQKKILQMKDSKCSRKRNVKILTTQQIVALDHCYLGLPKFMSKKKKGPVYAAPIDHDYVIGPRMDPSLEAEKDATKKRNESMEKNKELTKERLNIASKVKSKKSPKKEDQLSASAQISQIVASLKKDSTFRPEERMADETDFDDIVKALLDIGCSTSGSELDTDDKDFHNVTGENNLDNDLVDFLADMVSIEENENNEEEGDENLMNVDLSINDSAILDGLSDLDGNTSGSQEQIDWIPIGNIQQDQEVNMSNENEAFFQISNTIDILSQEPCCEDNKNQLNLKNIPDTQEEAFVSNLRPQDVEHVLDIIADKMVQNSCNVKGKEQQMHLDLNITNYADAANSGLQFPDSSTDEQKEVSKSKSNKVSIDIEQNCYIDNKHESNIIDAEKAFGICSDVSLSISSDETSETNTEECSLRADETLLSVSTNAGASETSLEKCSVSTDEKMNRIKEIFGSFPTQMDVESSHMFVEMKTVDAANSKLSFQGNFSEDLSKFSDSTSNEVDHIHHEQNCDIINEHESDVFNVGKDFGICAEVSLTVSANDEVLETNNEDYSLPADGKLHSVFANDETSETINEEFSIPEDEKSNSFSDKDDASETNNEECSLSEVEKSQGVSANDETLEISNEECSVPENEKSHSVSANDEASETINKECSLQADVKSDSVSTKDKASETTTERCSLIVDEKMNKIKEIFGSLPTQINLERSCIAIDVQKKDDVKIQSKLLSGSTDKLQDSGVFVLSDNEVDVLQV